jgi:hypothetical protein
MTVLSRFDVQAGDARDTCAPCISINCDTLDSEALYVPGRDLRAELAKIVSYLLMTHNAGMTCFGKKAENQNAGLISIVSSPDSETTIGVATLTGKPDATGRLLYTLSLKQGTNPRAYASG